jgi:hypothetical protein
MAYIVHFEYILPSQLTVPYVLCGVVFRTSNMTTLILCTSGIASDDKLFDLLIGFVEIIVNDDLVVWCLSTVSKVHLVLCLLESLQDSVLLVRGATP